MGAPPNHPLIDGFPVPKRNMIINFWASMFQANPPTPVTGSP